MERTRIYLDWNATTPPSVRVVDAMREAALAHWANPASIHGDGRKARSVVEDAREAVALLAGADARDIVFTSGGTEANNLALRSAFPVQRGTAAATSRRRLLTSRIEHPSIVRTAEALAADGRADVRWLAVTEDGQVDLGDLEHAVREEGGVTLLAMQAVNHETGAIQPLEAAAALLPPAALFHVDAVQAWGKVEFKAKVATTLSLAAHKFRGPKGIGALVTRPCMKLVPLLTGGAQERGLRPGTVDPVAAAGLAAACSDALDKPARFAAVSAHRDRLVEAILAMCPQSAVNGRGERAPHVANVSVGGWRGPELVAALDLEGVSVSSGSACSAGTAEPSPVVEAMVGRARAESAVRFSLGELTTERDVEHALATLERIFARASSA